MDKFDGEDAAADDIARLAFDELRLDIVAVLGELVAQNTERQTGRIDRDMDVAQNIRQCADVVFVSVRDENAADLIFIFFQICDVRNDKVDAGHFVVREAHAAVDDDDIVFVFQNGDILTDLFQAAEGKYFQFACGFCLFCFCHNVPLGSFLSILRSITEYTTVRYTFLT